MIKIKLIKKDKKGISEIINYVLLVSLAIIMASAIFAWMKFYVQKPLPEESCPEVSIILSEYSCNVSEKMLNISVQNKGRFDIDGFIVRINNGTSSYLLIEGRSHYINAKLAPNEAISKTFNYSRYNTIKEIELEATKGLDKIGRPKLCENSLIKQKLENCN